MIVAYIVSISCFNVFDVAIDTVFLCYIYDEAMVAKHGACRVAWCWLWLCMSNAVYVRTNKYTVH